MNLVDCVVVRVLAQPRYEYGHWWVKVRYNSWGRESETEIMCDTLMKAEDIAVGHKFEA
jgi:hypothetical protein